MKNQTMADFDSTDDGRLIVPEAVMLTLICNSDMCLGALEDIFKMTDNQDVQKRISLCMEACSRNVETFAKMDKSFCDFQDEILKRLAKMAKDMGPP